MYRNKPGSLCAVLCVLASISSAWAAEEAVPVPKGPGAPIASSFTGPLWQMVAPAGGSASISDGHLFLGVPGGSNHDPLIPANQAVRVVQPVGNNNFDVAIKIDSMLVATDANTSQGIMTVSNDKEFITFGLTTDGTKIGLNLSAHVVSDGVGTTVLVNVADFSAYQNPMYLRMNRTGSIYTAFYSTDGADWTQASRFNDSRVPTAVGVFASNYNLIPADAVPVVMSVNWFHSR